MSLSEEALKATAGKVYDAVKYDPGMTVAKQQLVKTATTLTKAINVALLQIAALNYGYEKAKAYFTEKFESEMNEKASTIPPDQVVEPKASVAGPALQGLAFSHEEPDLKEMYLNLLKSAMDGRMAEQAHPAFVETIRQLTADEARLLKLVLECNSPLPIVEIRISFEDRGGMARSP